MNVLLNSITAITMLHALILWEEKKAFSAAVTVDILEMVSTALVSYFPCTESLSNIDNDSSFSCMCNDGYTGNGMICDSEN